MFMPLMSAMTNCTDLRGHPCVTNLEGVNARRLTRDQIGLRAKGPLNCLVCDVSFIRLSLVLPPAMSLLVSGGWMVALIKPQFEAGRAAIGKNGVVSDPGVHARVCNDFAAWFAETFPDWQGHEIVPSPIVGPQGNQEFLFGARAPDYKSTPEIYSMSADQAPRAASPFILARWANAACAVAVFSALPPQALRGAACSARP